MFVLLVLTSYRHMSLPDVDVSHASIVSYRLSLQPDSCLCMIFARFPFLVISFCLAALVFSPKGKTLREYGIWTKCYFTHVNLSNLLQITTVANVIFVIFF